VQRGFIAPAAALRLVPPEQTEGLAQRIGVQQQLGHSAAEILGALASGDRERLPRIEGADIAVPATPARRR
jgi:hypothetical protein